MPLGLDPEMSPATVRWPGVRIAPTTSAWTQSQLRSLKASPHTRKTRTISLGRASMAHPFWHVGRESTVPCPFASVYQLDKAELRLTPARAGE